MGGAPAAAAAGRAGCAGQGDVQPRGAFPCAAAPGDAQVPLSVCERRVAALPVPAAGNGAAAGERELWCAGWGFSRSYVSACRAAVAPGRAALRGRRDHPPGGAPAPCPAARCGRPGRWAPRQEGAGGARLGACPPPRTALARRWSPYVTHVRNEFEF